MSVRSQPRIQTILVIAPGWKQRADFGVKSLSEARQDEMGPKAKWVAYYE